MIYLRAGCPDPYYESTSRRLRRFRRTDGTMAPIPVRYPRPGSFRSAEELTDHLERLGVAVPLETEVARGDSDPLRRPIEIAGRRLTNRWCVLPMEGWDGTRGGKPSDLTRRRWRRFGLSGAKLIWGGEAVAVRHDGRANPNQLCLLPENVEALAGLRRELVDAHSERFGGTDDLLVGLQLTHSGRFARPNHHDVLEPRIVYRHPLLDARFGITDDSAVLSDEDLDLLVTDFVEAARRAKQAGFDFVDIKHCHGYLGHELLSAYDRPGRYGGRLDNRTRFLRTIVEGIRAEVPGLEIAVRVSLFDFVPFIKGSDGTGKPQQPPPYRYAFGGDGTGTGIDWTEPLQFLDICRSLGIRLVCVSAGSPYYNPHIQRPAAYPPSDGYYPPEDPFVGVARLLNAARVAKSHYPDLIVVASGYSYLQEWIPAAARGTVAAGWCDFASIGRCVLSYPELIADSLDGRPLDRRKICRTFSDCTTAPRNGLVSGCYPLDPFYKQLPEARRLAQIKAKLRDP